WRLWQHVRLRLFAVSPRCSVPRNQLCARVVIHPVLGHDALKLLRPSLISARARCGKHEGLPPAAVVVRDVSAIRVGQRGGARLRRRFTYAKLQIVSATDSDPVALQHFELAPEPVPAEVLGAESLEVWALRLSGGPVRDVLATDPVNVATREYVFAVPLDV